MDCDGFWKSQYHSTERRNSLMLIFTRYVRRTESCLGNSDLAYIGVGTPPAVGLLNIADWEASR